MRIQEVMEDQYIRHMPGHHLSEWKDPWAHSQLNLPREFSSLLTGVDPNNVERIPRAPGLDRLPTPVLKQEGAVWMAAVPQGGRVQLVYFDPRSQEYRSITDVPARLPHALVERFRDYQTGDYFVVGSRSHGGFA